MATTDKHPGAPTFEEFEESNRGSLPYDITGHSFEAGSGQPLMSSQPAKQDMNLDPPPPYMPDGTHSRSMPPSRLFWRNYSKDQNAYCASECCVRTVCCPCFCVSLVISSPCTCIAAVSHCLSCCFNWMCSDGKPEKPKEGDLCWCCCAFKTLDRFAPIQRLGLTRNASTSRPAISASRIRCAAPATRARGSVERVACSGSRSAFPT